MTGSDNAGIPLGLYVSGDSKCVAVIDFAKLYAAPKQAAPLQYLVDTTNFDPVATGVVKFYAIPSE